MASNIGDLTGKTLGTSTLEKLLGQGGMGAVYLAKQTRPARHVAIKVLHPRLALNSQVYQEFLARFRREADVIARLEHVNIMPIYEYGEQDGLAYLVMPYLTGGSLRDVLAKRGALPLQEVLTYIDQAASALDYAHAQGVIHRDLKPANFLLHADGRLVLADFGIARIMEENTLTAVPTLTGTGMMLGTPEYMAPEMARGESLDYRADIYELGIVLFQLLSGHAPFTGNTPYAVAVKHIQEPLPLLHQTNPTIPSTIDAVIQKATAKQREDRYPSALAMAQALHEASTSTTNYQASNQENVPTISSHAQPVLAPPPSYNTPSANAAWLNAAQPAAGYAPAPLPSTYPTSQTPPNTYPSVRANQQPWWLFIGILLALVLVIGGVLIGLQLNRGTQGTTPTPIPTTGRASQPASQTTPTITTTNPSTPTAQPTSTPGITATTTTPATITTGAQLYAASSPGAHCDTNGGSWSDYNGVKITCLGNKTQISNTSPSAALQGTFLTKLPGQNYPSDYVVQVQLQQDQHSSNDFGIYFRNQPGNQQGVYTLLIHPDGTWSAYVYDNNTGAPKKLTGGPLGDSHAPLTLAIMVKGQQFSFYANGKLLGSASDQSYANGTVGIAVDQGVTITASNFALYTTAS